MRLPFNDDTVVADMAGRTMCVATNSEYSPFHSVLGLLTLRDDGSTSEGYLWNTDDGVLRIVNSQGSTLYEFRALETKNGCIYALGSRLQSEKQGVRERVVLYEQRSLSDVRWGVCISSHMNYHKDAVPVLIKSLKKAGMEMSKVYVCVGGAKNEKSHNENGYEHREVKEDFHGFTALSVVVKEQADVDYWLLLHDTCDVEIDFLKRILNLDVGLNPDMVLFRNLADRLELGLYSSGFLDNISSELSLIRPLQGLDNLVSNARVVMLLDFNSKDGGEKDIYGTGTKRRIFTIPSAGIRKFRGSAKDGGKP